jgi:hypothetical protein
MRQASSRNHWLSSSEQTAEKISSTAHRPPYARQVAAKGPPQQSGECRLKAEGRKQAIDANCSTDGAARRSPARHEAASESREWGLKNRAEVDCVFVVHPLHPRNGLVAEAIFAVEVVLDDPGASVHARSGVSRSTFRENALANTDLGVVVACENQLQGKIQPKCFT